MLPGNCAISDKKPLVDWVGEFLFYREDSVMLGNEAAEIIVNEIIKALDVHEDLNQSGLYQLPDPRSFFQVQEE